MKTLCILLVADSSSPAFVSIYSLSSPALLRNYLILFESFMFPSIEWYVFVSLLLRLMITLFYLHLLNDSWRLLWEFSNSWVMHFSLTYRSLLSIRPLSATDLIVKFREANRSLTSLHYWMSFWRLVIEFHFWYVFFWTAVLPARNKDTTRFLTTRP